MENNILIEAKEDITEIFIEFAEEKLDDVFAYDIIRDVPVMKVVCSIAKAIVGVRSAYQIKMIKQFLDTVNSGVATPGDIRIHLDNLKLDPEKFRREVNYILVKINSWTDLEKSTYFGNLYIAYIQSNKKDLNSISWEQFTLFTEILSQLILYDIDALRDIYNKYKYSEDDVPDFGSMLRLKSLGLVSFHDGFVRQTSKNIITGNVKKERGHITGDGKVFYKLITEHKVV